MIPRRWPDQVGVSPRGGVARLARGPLWVGARGGGARSPVAPGARPSMGRSSLSGLASAPRGLLAFRPRRCFAPAPSRRRPILRRELRRSFDKAGSLPNFSLPPTQALAVDTPRETRSFPSSCGEQPTFFSSPREGPTLRRRRPPGRAALPAGRLRRRVEGSTGLRSASFDRLAFSGLRDPGGLLGSGPRTARAPPPVSTRPPTS